MADLEVIEKHTKPFKRYKFDRNLRDEIAKYTFACKSDNYHGPLAISADWIIIIFCIAMSKYVYNNINLFLIWFPIYFIAICIIGARQRGLERGLHEATHECFCSNKYLNFFLGTFCSGYVMFQSFYGYKTSHVKNHHPYLGTDRDPDYQGLKANQICGKNRTSTNVKRYLRSLFFPSASFNYLQYLIKYRIWTKDDNHFETLVRGIYLLSIITILIHTGNGSLLLLYWLVPYFTTHMWIGSFIELLEHYPMIETAPRIDIFMTRNRLCGWLWDCFFSVHNENYHLVHHLFPHVPEWEYHNVHKILMQDSTYANIHKNTNWRYLLKEIIEVDDK